MANLEDKDLKKLKSYVMPNYNKLKVKSKHLFPLYWKNSQAAWKQMKVFKKESKEDRWFASLSELTKPPIWPLMHESEPKAKVWRLKYLLSVLNFKQKLTFFENLGY